jgi:hypothetical protein
MPHLLIVILDDLKHMPALLQVWQTVGVPRVALTGHTSAL